MLKDSVMLITYPLHVQNFFAYLTSGQCLNKGTHFMDEKIKLVLRPGVMLPIDDYFLYRDSYNQIWKLTRTPDPNLPFTISLEDKLYETVSPLEKYIRKYS